MTSIDPDLADSLADALPDVDWRKLMEHTTELRAEFLAGLRDRPVGVDTSPDATAALTAALAGPLQDTGHDPFGIIGHLADLATLGIVASRGPRYGGFVVGGNHPVAEAADNLVATWDQFAASHAGSPLIAMAERTALAWLISLGGLDVDGRTWSGGFTTGTSESHIVGLAVALHHLCAQRGHDVTRDGLRHAPPVRFLVPDSAHRSVEHALSVLGIGSAQAERLPIDRLGRILTAPLGDALRTTDPGTCVVVGAAGEINTGAFDNLDRIADLCEDNRAWLHVDAAFGYLTAASPELAHLTAGRQRADSIAFDGHKALQCPYDVGVILCAHPDAHRNAMTTAAVYTTAVPSVDQNERYDAMDYVLGMARRGRGLPVYAVLRALGRNGIAAVQNTLHRNAVRLGRLIDGRTGIALAAPVTWNQVLFDVAPVMMHPREVPAFNQAVIDEIRRDGVTWLGGTRFAGREMLRYSMCNYTTTFDDVDDIALAIRLAVARVRSSTA